MSTRQYVAAVATALLASGLPLVSAVHAAPPASGVMNADTDADETLDLAEVKVAASAHFDTLDTDGDGTLDAQEVKGLIGAKSLKEADPDNDGSISKDEYLALVERLFKKADVDADGTLDVTELHSRSAAALRRLIR